MEKVSMLVYIEYAGDNKKGRPLGRYRCNCGNETITEIERVKSLHTKSCGCLSKKHGLKKHPLYPVWKAMNRRCSNPNDNAYHHYGGRGVRVCDEWISGPRSFIDWAEKNGWEPGLHLDKDIKGDGLLYSPDRCQFITRTENSNHRRNNVKFLYNGESKTVPQWAKHFGIPKGTVVSRLGRGWSFDDSVTKPISKTGKRKWK